MYPGSLILNKENSVDSGADVLDLTIEIGGDSKFKVSVYDKRDSYKFNVIRFSPRVSNIPENIGYSTFTSQIIRYIKICTEFESCEIRIVNYILIWQIFPRLWKGVGEGGCWMM